MHTTPTIKDVAQVAGVHFTTVSKALRGNPSIPAATRARILSVAQRIGYRRNEVFSALSSQRQRNTPEYFAPKIAYIANRSPEAGFHRGLHHRMFCESARSQAEALGYSFELLFVDKGYHDSKSLNAYLREQGISGVIVGAFEPGRAELQLDWEEFAIVKIDSQHLHPPATLVSTDQLYGVLDSHARLRRLGYRRIGLAVGMEDEKTSEDSHLAALLLAQRDIPKTQRTSPLFFPFGSNGGSVTRMLHDWVLEQRLDAVVCNWANIGQMLRDGGFKCPSEIAYACLCLTQKDPEIAGIVANLDLVGRRVVSLLAALLREEKRGIPEHAATTHVRGSWYPGKSAPGRGRSTP